ncbi:SAM-dependent methyltransferase [Leptospira perolatii]|uniref:SAM-dependent methyltransferase n=1 Tax=Leptospira perolatii TaxID=2023191 RepID=A0A2M9ZRU7_9LEPT|nr:class I SAM-dependent methyltransferase [Leptospira perolatii]PJZ71259.1 SAM-dependent methyltransferase [Leptospira perolatii]PJZ74792.1 SAM-dependent methyltransferase [Leptospira perolatii]
MSDLEYYYNLDYQNFLLSSRRRDLTPPELIFKNFPLSDVSNLVDFGMGLGFWTHELLKRIQKEGWVWGAECNQDFLDEILHWKNREEIDRFTPFYMEKADRPLLPEWIPVPDAIFASLVLSTFPDPGLAMDGLVRSMRVGGRLIVLDWMKNEYPIGPKINDKISLDKMKFLAEQYHLDIVKTVRVSDYIYGLEIKAGTGFEYGYYDLKEEETYSEELIRS